jgi:hypothetical protein
LVGLFLDFPLRRPLPPLKRATMRAMRKESKSKLSTSMSLRQRYCIKHNMYVALALLLL